MATSIAQRLADTAARALGGPLPIALRAWDGSEVGAGGIAGPAVGPTLVVNNRQALRRLIWSPNENGLADAYVTGDIDVDGDLRAAFTAMWTSFEAGEVAKPGLSDVLKLAPSAVRLGAIGRRPPGVSDAAHLSGEKHTRSRDRAAIAHHYDLSNEFYELLLDESMAYSCAYFVDGPTGDLATAQRAKLDLICRKLGLSDGRQLLDIGCGWGSLICHAGQHYGAVATGVTLSEQQHAYVTKRVADAGLADRVTVRLADYRELLDGADDGWYDAVSTIEMGEHVGDAEYPAFAGILHRVLKPGGRALVQQMSRGDHQPGGGSFIETYIAPDMHMKPLATTLGLIAGAGLEIRDVHALREHYDWTVSAWERTLKTRWSDVEELIGRVGARVWRLYLVGGGLSFAQGRMGVDQILAVRPHDDGASGMPPFRGGWE